jgi:phosphohistidine phosphatase SixA
MAEDSAAGQPDSDRALTAEGHAHMKQIGRGLERALPRVQSIHSSPFLRAVQTALWISKGYRSRAPVEQHDGLVPGSDASGVIEMIATIPGRRIVLVGHEPVLSRTAAALLRLPAIPTQLEKGGCYGIRLLADGAGVLEWVLTPRILRKLGE